MCAGWPHTPHCGDPFSGGSEGTEYETSASSERTATAPFLPGRGAVRREEGFSHPGDEPGPGARHARWHCANPVTFALLSKDVKGTIANFLSRRFTKRAITPESTDRLFLQYRYVHATNTLRDHSRTRRGLDANRIGFGVVRIADELRRVADRILGRNAHPCSEVDQILGIGDNSLRGLT